MAFEIKGTVVHIGPTQQVTDKLKKRELVVEYVENNSQYKEELRFEAVNDKCASMDELRNGDEVEVHFNLRGRSYTDKQGKKGWFNSMQVWKFNKIGSSTPQYNPPADIKSQEEDDLPF